MEQRHGHYDEGIGRPNTSAFSRPLDQENFIEPGTDTPGPQPIGSAFVPFPNRDTQNRMPLVVPQPRTNNTNQENAHPQHNGPDNRAFNRGNYPGSSSQASRQPPRQATPARIHDSNLMPPPSNPQGVNVHRSAPTPGDTVSTHSTSRSTHSTINSIDPEFNRTPIPEMPREPIPQRRFQRPNNHNDEMFRAEGAPLRPEIRSPGVHSPPPHNTPERPPVSSSLGGLAHPEGSVQYHRAVSPLRDRGGPVYGPGGHDHPAHRPAPSHSLRPRRLEMVDIDRTRPVTASHQVQRVSEDFDYGDVDHRHHNRLPVNAHSPNRHRISMHTGHYRRSVSPPQPRMYDNRSKHEHLSPTLNQQRVSPRVNSVNQPGVEAGGLSSGGIPMEVDPLVTHSTVPQLSFAPECHSALKATSSHQHVPNRTVHSVASHPTRPSQYPQVNPRFRASTQSNQPLTTRDHHPATQPLPLTGNPTATHPTGHTSNRVALTRPQFDRYNCLEPHAPVVQPQVAISPTHHQTYPAALAPAVAAPVPLTSVNCAHPVPIESVQVNAPPTIQAPPPLTQYHAAPKYPNYTQPVTVQPSYAPPQPQRNQYQTPSNNQAPQPHGHYREFSPMELDHPHEAAPRYHQQRQRSRSPSPYRRSRSDEFHGDGRGMDHSPYRENRRSERGRERSRRDYHDERGHGGRENHERSGSDRRRGHSHCSSCCSPNRGHHERSRDVPPPPTRAPPPPVPTQAPPPPTHSQPPPPSSPKTPHQMASQNQLVPAINQNQLHNQHNQLALQQNRSTSDLIQMSNLSTQIQMNGIQHTLGAMLVPILKDQGVQQGHREMQQSYQVQNDIRDLRTQFSDMTSLMNQQKDELRNQFKDLLSETQKQNTPKVGKTQPFSANASERSGPSRRPDLIRTPDSSSNSQYSDADQCSPHSAGRRAHRYQRHRHEPYTTTRGEYSTSENSPQSPHVHQRRLQRNISGNSGGFSSAQSSPIDSAMEEHSFQANSISPNNNQFQDLTTDQVCAKLQEWQVTQEIVQNFRRENIAGRHLNYLSEYMIKKGILDLKTETENPRAVRPLAERLGPLKTVCRALKMNVGTAKSLPTTEGHEVMSMNSPDDVMLWLRSIGLNEYSRNFAEEQVNGANLLELCESDLIQLGMEKLGDRLTFMLERDMLN